MRQGKRVVSESRGEEEGEKERKVGNGNERVKWKINKFKARGRT